MGRFIVKIHWDKSTQLLIQQQLTGLQSMLRASRLGISPEEVASLSQQASLTRQKSTLIQKEKCR